MSHWRLLTNHADDFSCNFYNSFAIDCPNTFKHIYGDSIFDSCKSIVQIQTPGPGL